MALSGLAGRGDMERKPRERKISGNHRLRSVETRALIIGAGPPIRGRGNNRWQRQSLARTTPPLPLKHKVVGSTALVNLL